MQKYATSHGENVMIDPKLTSHYAETPAADRILGTSW